VNRPGFSLLENLTQVINDAVFMKERFFLAVLIVMKINLHAAMEKTCDLQPLADCVRIEISTRENRWVRRKRNRRSSASDCPLELL